MILCRCSSCGVACKFDAALAGGTTACPICGEPSQVPAASDPTLLEVFREDAESTCVLTHEEFQEKQQNGEIPFTDTVWRDDHWEPVGLANWPDEGHHVATADLGKPQLRIRSATAPDTEETIELPLIDMAPAAANGTGSGNPLDSRGTLAGPPPQPAVPKPPKPIIKLLNGLTVVVVIFFGYEYGFGPILFNFLKKPMVVIVKNGEAADYEGQLGWRRMRQPVPANGIARFELHVGMPESQTLTLTPAAAGKGQPLKVKIPMAPGRAIIVNVRGKTTFYKVDHSKTRELKIDSEAGVMASQILAKQAPAAAQSVTERMKEIATTGIVGTCNDPLIDALKYRTEYHFQQLTNPQGKTIGATDKIQLTAMPGVRFEFAGGSVQRVFANPDAVDGSLTMTGGTVKLLPDVTIKIPEKTALQVTRNQDTIQIRFAVDGQPLSVPKGNFKGRWDYQATKAMKTQTWTWAWVFSGDGTYDGGSARVRCRWDGDVMPKVENLEKTVKLK